MISSKCEKCGGYMLVNYILTPHLLSSKLIIAINEDGTKNIEGLSNDVVMTCPRCNGTKHSTFDDLILDFKSEMMTKLLRHRSSQVAKNLDRTKLKEENGISYCGMCAGPFDDGYCYNDVILQCIVRKNLKKAVHDA